MKVARSVPFLLGILVLVDGDLVNILRRRRTLVYPDPRESETKVQVLFGLGLPMEAEVSMTLGYVLKCNYNLPYNASTVTTNNEGNELRLLGVSRWSLYQMLERFVGRGCLLRAICEAAESPIDREGILGQLVHLILTPSITKEEFQDYADREYRAAERFGLYHDCAKFFIDCPDSPLDYFTGFHRYTEPD